MSRQRKHFAPGELKNHPLCVAARENDNDADHFGFYQAIEKQGLDVDELFYVAEQRALRTISAARGELVDTTHAVPFLMTDEEQKTFGLLVVAALDGMLVGWRGRQHSIDIVIKAMDGTI